MQVPTERWFHRLRILGRGSTVLSPRKREWRPDPTFAGRNHEPFLPPLRITAEGYRALAAATERYGLPSTDPRWVDIDAERRARERRAER